MDKRRISGIIMQRLSAVAIFQEPLPMRNIPALLALTFAIPLLSACAVPAFLGGAAATSTAVAHGDRRTPAGMAPDLAIELKINDSVYSDPVIGPQVHVNATSYNQVVLLTGEVPTQEVLDHIDALANQIPGVKRIYNDLQIAAPSSVESRANDSWITYNVKGWLLRKSNLKITDIKIVTERGTVYLMGLVTPEESDAVADIVRRIEGVDRVVKAFEYPGDVAKPATATPAGPG